MRVTLDLLHEFAHTKVFCLFHNCMWQSRHAEVDVYVLAPREQTRWLCINKSPCSNMIFVYVFVCVFVLIWTFNRHGHTTGKQVTLFLSSVLWQSRSKHFPTRTGLLHSQNRSPCSNNWIFWSLVGFVGSLSTSGNFWTQFFHLMSFKRNLWRKWRWRIYFLVNDFSRFHHDSLRDTISWKRVVKDDCVRSFLIELKSFLLSKFDVNPIHRVLMFLPYFLLVPSKTRCIHVNFIWISMFLVHWIHRREEYRLYFAQILSSSYQSWIHDGV